MTWLEDLLGIKDLWSDGVAVSPRRKALEFISGTGVALALVDDPATGRSKLTISAAGGGGSGSSDYRESVRVATTGALPAYTRVGNVLTANANGALPAIDGVTLTVGTRRVLVWHGASGIDNGTYDVTQIGDGSNPWILTRTQDALGNTETFTDGTHVPIAEGTLYAGRTFKVTTNDPIVLNTTAITWTPDTGLPDGSAVDQVARWDGSTWLAGALNLAAAAAVTGVLAVANGGTGLNALGAANTVLKVNAAGTLLEYGKLTTANLDASAGIVGTQLAAGANILGSQLSATAAIAASQLADGGANTVLQGGTPNTWTATPTVTTLNATTVASSAITGTYLALGADPADAGAIRLSHAMGVYGESNTPGTDRAVITWGVVGNDVVGVGDAGTVTRVTGSALHAYAGATQVGQLGVATSDFIKMGDVPASTGYLRVDDSWTLKQRNANPGTADRAVITCGGESLIIGDPLYTGLTQIKGSTTTIEAGASQAIIVYATAGNSALVLDANGASFGLGIFRAQGALDCNVRNASTGGASYSTRIQGYNGSAWTTGMRVQNVASGNCSVHIGENAGNISLWDATGSFGSGVGVLFGKTRTTAPSTAPVGGGLLYFDASGNPWSVDTGGIHVQLN